MDGLSAGHLLLVTSLPYLFGAVTSSGVAPSVHSTWSHVLAAIASTVPVWPPPPPPPPPPAEQDASGVGPSSWYFPFF